MSKRQVVYHRTEDDCVHEIDKEEFSIILELLKAFINRADAFAWKVLQSKTLVKFTTSRNAKSQNSNQWKME